MTDNEFQAHCFNYCNDSRPSNELHGQAVALIYMLRKKTKQGTWVDLWVKPLPLAKS